ncbi:hypothetical protein SODALDRAFT_105923 [Sodiomyces alkalinus F11]|uniref:Uncharacterized protein n=1 Tax=Sodiomyces alkalinus (strain CBS 110278 / VKM F-3762 / F11) TaxID=1314773 RepID=A0A3N2Q258_SODAK|nr:hypothetical protein SODALDRAFT_105923 [Sodiomyces alkalinus F11]ROT40844.1 hypothetical protein SODALDRAFT_105923 [Sodiomyces alkalinus F11]
MAREFRTSSRRLMMLALFTTQRKCRIPDHLIDESRCMSHTKNIFEPLTTPRFVSHGYFRIHPCATSTNDMYLHGAGARSQLLASQTMGPPPFFYLFFSLTANKPSRTSIWDFPMPTSLTPTGLRRQSLVGRVCISILDTRGPRSHRNGTERDI